MKLVYNIFSKLNINSLGNILNKRNFKCSHDQNVFDKYIINICL